MQIKTTMRHHLTPVRIVNTKITMAERVWRKGSPPTLLLGMKVASGTVENSMEDPQKTKSRITLYSSNPNLGIYMHKTIHQKKDMYPYIHSSTIHNSQTWKQRNVHRQTNGCGTWRECNTTQP